MNQSLRRLATVVSLSLAAAGCSDPDAIATSSTTAFASDQTDLSSLTYRAVDLILAAAPDVSRKTPLVVASPPKSNVRTPSAAPWRVAERKRSPAAL